MLTLVQLSVVYTMLTLETPTAAVTITDTITGSVELGLVGWIEGVSIVGGMF